MGEFSTKKEKTNWDRLDVGIEHEGRAIKLPGDPEKMPLRKAKEALERKIKDEEQMFRVFEVIENAHPFDAAVAFSRAMANLYGWASPQTVYTFFGPQPPTFLSIKTGLDDADVVQCPMGQFVLPGVDEPVNAIFHKHPNKDEQVFLIHAEIKKRDKHILLELATETRRLVKERSIYRGKAIRLGVNAKGILDVNTPPAFMDVASKDPLIFDKDIQDMIDTNILVPIEFTAQVKNLKIPLKRTILLEGPYGTGKSLTARMAARMCEENGWTFVLLDKVQGLRAALEFANRYAPAVVFAEDIDRVTENRDDNTNDLINTIDGVLSKNSQIMTILTTNFADRLDKAMVRPGRLDAVISLRAPSDEAVERLLRVYAGDLLDANASVVMAAKELSGQIPASIRECVERAKLGMIGRKDTHLSDEDLVVAAKTMKNHLALLNRESVMQSPAERFAESMREVILNGRGEKIDLVPEVQETVDKIKTAVGVR